MSPWTTRPAARRRIVRAMVCLAAWMCGGCGPAPPRAGSTPSPNGSATTPKASATPQPSASSQPSATPQPSAASQTSAAPTPSSSAVWFRDVSTTAGLELTYRNGEEADRYTILESLGGGIAMLDYDRDGLLDLYATGGGEFVGTSGAKNRGRPGKLFRNRGSMRFEDVTATVGLVGPSFYSHGALAGDIDNDGWPDLLVTGYRGMVLYHNEPVQPAAEGSQSTGTAGDGMTVGASRRFVDVTEAWGLRDDRWCTSAAWADLWGDGRLDLYVCRYLDWSETNDPVCPRPSSPTQRDVCPPQRFQPVAHSLYRHTGQRFVDVSDSMPLAAGKGLGVVIADLNDDGRPDVYVANDDGENRLYRNEGRGRFMECAREAGVAVDDNGRYNGSMGVDVGDFDGSGRASLVVTNFQGELPALYANQGGGQFLHQSLLAGLGAVGQEFVGFGTALCDYDNDGWLDLAILNGHVVRYPTGAPFRQRPLLFRNESRGSRRFFRATAAAGGVFFNEPALGRGLAAGDLDNDGWLDLVASRCNQPLALLRNVAKQNSPPSHWVGVELARRDGRPCAGAIVRVSAGDRVWTRFAKSGGSYLSSPDPRIVIGVGAVERLDAVTVRWPWGETQTWNAREFRLDRYWRLVEGNAAQEVVSATAAP